MAAAEVPARQPAVRSRRMEFGFPFDFPSNQRERATLKTTHTQSDEPWVNLFALEPCQDDTWSVTFMYVTGCELHNSLRVLLVSSSGRSTTHSTQSAICVLKNWTIGNNTKPAILGVQLQFQESPSHPASLEPPQRNQPVPLLQNHLKPNKLGLRRKISNLLLGDPIRVLKTKTARQKCPNRAEAQGRVLQLREANHTLATQAELPISRLVNGEHTKAAKHEVLKNSCRFGGDYARVTWQGKTLRTKWTNPKSAVPAPSRWQSTSHDKDGQETHPSWPRRRSGSFPRHKAPEGQTSQIDEIFNHKFGRLLCCCQASYLQLPL